MKKIILLFLISTLSFAELSKSQINEFENKYNELEKEQLSLAIAHFQSLTEWSLALREESLTFAKKILDKRTDQNPISGADLETLQIGIKQHLKLRKLMLDLVHHYQNQAELQSTKHKISSNELIKIKSKLLPLATAAILYDNFYLAVTTYHDKGFLRRIINRANKGFGIDEDCLEEVAESFYSVSNRKKIRKVLKSVKSMRPQLEKIAKRDKELGYLMLIIDTSVMMEKIENNNDLGDYARKLSLLGNGSVDSFWGVTNFLSGKTSQVFGNTVGLVEVRKGKLYNKRALTKEIQSQLKPMDILLEKTPFRLTDKLIPGYFGHVAIWLGTEQELKESGLWNHELIKPHQKEIKEGKCVLEALRSGVVLNSLEHFMNIDDLAVLRSSKPIACETLTKRAFRQVGKDYDFNFDVETLDSIVCSELVYQVFTDFKWPTESVMGRCTISPDNVAQKVTKEFTTPLLYIDGQEITSNRDAKIIELINTK